MTKPRLQDNCPNRDKHTPSPDGYLQWHAWASRMVKNHKQVRCPDCGLWAIWIPKPPKIRAERQT